MPYLSIQRSSCLPDENNVVALQEEVKQMKLRELETLRSFREMQDTVTELNQRWQVTQQSDCCRLLINCPWVQLHTAHDLCPLQHHMSRGSGTGGGGGHWKESPKKNAMNELQDKLMTVRLREAEAQAELREVKLKALQLESQVRQTADSHSLATMSKCAKYTQDHGAQYCWSSSVLILFISML